jgi:hypothetical protein
MLTAQKVLEHYYLESRCMLLEIAATLDRYDRAAASGGNGQARQDPRLEQLYQALQLLSDRKIGTNRAEQLLNLFSDPA